MPDTQSTFAIFAEVSVALAGFSGIVIAFGKRSLGALTSLEVRRLSNLFMLSGLVLMSSLLGICALHVDGLNPGRFWQASSAILFLIIAPWLCWDVLRLTRLERQERAQVNRVILYSFNALAVAVLLLQLANAVLLRSSWPVFIALTAAIGGAFQQFILLVRMGYLER